MGVYIKGMEMPEKTYAHCMLIKDIDGSVQLHVCTKDSEVICEWEFYDLVPVPPHGRLIDADALDTSILQAGFSYAITRRKLRYTPGEVRQKIANAPTVIPAEPPKEE